jgi:hypothetical protein
MLYLIGGAARSGKSLVARRLLRGRLVPYSSTDYLISGLAAGAPGLGLQHGLPSRVHGELARPILGGAPREGPRVAASHGAARVRACFLGYARCTIPLKRASIRAAAGSIDDWVAGMTEEALAEMVSEIRLFSELLEDECRANGVRCFDGSADFEAALEQAEAYLLDGAP